MPLNKVIKSPKINWTLVTCFIIRFFWNQQNKLKMFDYYLKNFKSGFNRVRITVVNFQIIFKILFKNLLKNHVFGIPVL